MNQLIEITPTVVPLVITEDEFLTRLYTKGGDLGLLPIVVKGNVHIDASRIKLRTLAGEIGNPSSKTWVIQNVTFTGQVVVQSMRCTSLNFYRCRFRGDVYFEQSNAKKARLRFWCCVFRTVLKFWECELEGIEMQRCVVHKYIYFTGLDIAEGGSVYIYEVKRRGILFGKNIDNRVFLSAQWDPKARPNVQTEFVL
ncbi:MAG: hypothetical protein WCG97_00570 [bacterium]